MGVKSFSKLTPNPSYLLPCFYNCLLFVLFTPFLTTIFLAFPRSLSIALCNYAYRSKSSFYFQFPQPLTTTTLASLHHFQVRTIYYLRPPPTFSLLFFPSIFMCFSPIALHTLLFFETNEWLKPPTHSFLLSSYIYIITLCCPLQLPARPFYVFQYSKE